MKYSIAILVLLVSAIAIIFSSCQKELTCYGAECLGVSVYSFLQSSGTCTDALINGTYKQETALTDSNTVTVKVNVTKKGAYTINSDTLNGFYFKGQGDFLNTGVLTVLLKGIGKPVAAGYYTFSSSKISGCSFAVRVDTIPFIEKYFYDVTIDGIRYQQTVDSNGIIMRNTYTPGQQTTTITSYIGTDGPFAINDSSNNNDGLFIVKRYIQSSNITLSSLAGFFSPGPQVLFPNSYSGNSDGIGIDWNNIDAEPVYDAWKSYNFPGTQTGSSFVITSVETYADAQGRPIAKVKASFNCILYNERGASKVLTDGKFYGEFANIQR